MEQTKAGEADLLPELLPLQLVQGDLREVVPKREVSKRNLSRDGGGDDDRNGMRESDALVDRRNLAGCGSSEPLFAAGDRNAEQ